MIRLHVCMMALILTVTTAAHAQFPTVLLGRAQTPPVMDGSLDDTAWETAAALAPFLLNDGTGLATQQTVVLACHDHENLYLGITARERSLEPMTQQLHLLKQQVTEHDGSVWGDESVEIFLQPSGSGEYYHLGANMLGTRYEARGMGGDFDADWTAEASADDRAWYLEIAIPFATFGGAPSAGDRWGLNICRNQNPNDERSSWSGLQGAFHQPEQFGHAVFGDSTAQVTLDDLSALSATASEMTLRIAGLETDAEASLTFRADRDVTERAGVAAGTREVSLRYPRTVSDASPQVRYQLARTDGTIIYQSPWFTQAAPVEDLSGTLVVEGGSGEVLHNGERVAALIDGRPASLSTPLQPGENVIALTLNGAEAVSGELVFGEQNLNFDRGWRWSADPADGWDRSGFDVHDWAELPAPDGDGKITLPAQEMALRRVIAVSDRRERFWPLETALYLPRGSEMFIKPLLTWVGAPPSDYVYCLDLPEPIRITQLDRLDGSQVAILDEQPIGHDGRAYTRYRIAPEGTLTGGFNIELLWKNNGSTQSQYVSASSLGGTFDWRDFEVEVTSPPFADLVGVLPLKWQNRGIYGECWFADISLVEKGTDENLLPQGDFSLEQWDDESRVVEVERDGRIIHALYLQGTKEQTDRQNGVWVSGPTIEVKPDTRYVLRFSAKGEGIHSDSITGRATLLADVGSPAEDTLTAYSHFEAMDGQIVEARRASTIHVLPEMKRRAPREVPIIACYSSSAFENPAVTEANAEMVRDAGINWLWGSNQSRLARLLKPDGMKFVWHIPRNGYGQAPVDREYLERHPDHRAVRRSGGFDDHQICPTILLDTDNEFIPAMNEWFAESLRENPYDHIDWDHEFPVTYDNSVCLCERCRNAFTQWAELGAAPSAEEVFAEHQDRWVEFRCRQNARMAGLIREAIKAVDPDVPFSVYSGYATDRTKWLYGVDWAMMAEHIDWAIAGYNGDRATIQKTMQTVGDIPFTSGAMYVESRYVSDRPYPDCMAWRTTLMRAMLDDEGGGLLIWHLHNLDGAGYWGVGWVAALVADFEPFFLDVHRRDDLVETTPELDESRLAVLTHGDERLIIVMNPGRTPEDITIRPRMLPRDAVLVEYETGTRHDPIGPVTLQLEPGAIRVLHLRAK